MGKLAEPHRLRCVHCHSTETPLWRTGPDGPKTLCNACGVRYKKGKLVLYKDDDGNLTAVKRENAVPVHIPPASKKLAKKMAAVHSPSAPSSPTEAAAAARRAVRKVPSEGTIAPVVGKKPRSRVRRVTAGQMPGRYVSKLPLDSHSWRSLSNSPHLVPSSPSSSPRHEGQSSRSFCTYPPSPISHNVPPLTSLSHPVLLSSSRVPFADGRRTPFSDPSLSMDTLPAQVCTNPEEHNLFSDMASLGLDCSASPDNHSLLPMPADPSSAEQFSFAFSGLGRDACLAIDNTPDRTEALRALIVDRSRKVSALYDIAVHAVFRLCTRRHARPAFASDHRHYLSLSADDVKKFVRAFAREHSAGLTFDFASDTDPCPVARTTASAVMLSDKAMHCAAIDSFRALMDSSDLVGFADAGLIELLAEDVAALLHTQHGPEYEHGGACRPADSAMGTTKPIPTPA